MSGDWLIEQHRGPASDLHAMAFPDDGRRRLWLLQPTGPAVVLGSTQPESLVDPAAATAAGAEVVRRRSGGGAVFVTADDPVWIDVMVPRDDPLWDDDVARAFGPVGRAWSSALTSVGVPGTRVHAGSMVRTEWSATVCFAGVGPGEVLLGGAKVVGISQRRTRAGARFQCAVHRHWDPGPLLALLTAPVPPGELDRAGVGIGPAPESTALLSALVEALTSDDHT